MVRRRLQLVWSPEGNDPEPVACTAQEEDAGSRSRRVAEAPTDTDHDLPPEICLKVLARGQSSTDLNIAQRRESLGLQLSRPVAQEGHKTAASAGAFSEHSACGQWSGKQENPRKSTRAPPGDSTR